ncbi:MAG TPA: cellulose biosynthesis cyclic di-GMP-binding regulatory protein BcsB, partial [Limnobacter sp.]|nr:cellulose biosynthesis cyclic di-GMP-binding regulatory protein BcsB [Limnobacter sp.]
MQYLTTLVLALFCLSVHALPADTAPSTTREQTRSLTFSQMGQPGGVRLTGTNRFTELSSGIRLDELVTRVSLDLQVLYPQGMRHDQSFIRVYVNNQLAGISPLSASRAGIPHQVAIELDPLLFSDFSNLRIEYDGTYDS